MSDKKLEREKREGDRAPVGAGDYKAQRQLDDRLTDEEPAAIRSLARDRPDRFFARNVG